MFRLLAAAAADAACRLLQQRLEKLPLPPLWLPQRRQQQLYGCRRLFLLPCLLPLLLLLLLLSFLLEQARELRKAEAVCLMLRDPVLHLAVPGAVLD